MMVRMTKADFPNYLAARGYSTINLIKKTKESDNFLPQELCHGFILVAYALHILNYQCHLKIYLQLQ